LGSSGLHHVEQYGAEQITENNGHSAMLTCPYQEQASG